MRAQWDREGGTDQIAKIVTQKEQVMYSVLSIEDAFWSTLKEIAQAQGATVSQTVTEIDKLRRGGTLSGAISLFVLDRVRSKKVGARRRQLRGMETGADSST